MMNLSGKAKPRILLTGATGYVGGHLLPELLDRDWPVRCLVRQRRAELPEPAQIVEGDLLHAESLTAAVAGIDCVVYLVHSMGDHKDFAEQDQLAARNLATAAAKAGVKRIIYLGGLGSDEEELSEHLRSRHEVGKALSSTGVQVTELRASIVLGPGSLSFEMIRALVERLPVMLTPSWVRTLSQPIGITDLLAYLVAAIEHEDTGHAIYEIGGADEVSYMDLMKEYARQRGLRRLMVPVAVLSPRLSGLWLGFVTPAQAAVGRQMVSSLKNPTVVQDKRALDVFQVKPIGHAAAIARAIRADEGPPHTEEFVHCSEMPVSAEALFAWHSQPGAFESLVPDWEHIKLIERKGGIQIGAQTILDVYIGPFHKRWIAEHTDYEEGRYFCDVQVQGPFVYWKHRHFMHPIDANHCILEDRVRFAPPFGVFGQWLMAGYMHRRLKRTFEFRHQATLEAVTRSP